MVEGDAERWLAENVRARREAAGLSQSQLAAAMVERGHRWSQNTVYKIEAATRATMVHEALALAGVLGTSVFTLVDQPARAGRSWKWKGLTDDLHEAFSEHHATALALAEARARLAAALARVDEHDEPGDVEDARADLAEYTGAAALALGDSDYAADQGQREDDQVRTDALMAEQPGAGGQG